MNLTADNTFNIPQVKSNLLAYRHPPDDLGAVHHPQATTLKLWAPTALDVQIALYADATDPTFSLKPMTCASNGIWSVTINGDLAGKYYLYQVAWPGLSGGQPTSVLVNDP